MATPAVDHDQCYGPGNCGNNAEFACKRCQVVRYCGKSCQRADWPSHKIICAKTPDERNDEPHNVVCLSLTSSHGFDTRPEMPASIAQDMMFDAWDCKDVKEKIAIANRALEVYPNCIDAFNTIGGDLLRRQKRAEEALRVFEQGICAAHRMYPAAEKAKRMLWGVPTNRPYLRALWERAIALAELRRYGDAIEQGKRLLTLNPSDNQGARSLVRTWMFHTKDWDGIEKLLIMYANCTDATSAFNHALLAFVRHQEGKASANTRNVLLMKAMKQNVYVADYLIAGVPVDLSKFFYITLGGESEAKQYAGAGIEAWKSVPGAMDWLKEIEIGFKK